MSETMILGLISLVGSLVGTFGGILASNRLTNYRLEKVEKAVEENHKIFDTVHKLETNDAVQDAKIETLEKRVQEAIG